MGERNRNKDGGLVIDNKPMFEYIYKKICLPVSPSDTEFSFQRSHYSSGLSPYLSLVSNQMSLDAKKYLNHVHPEDCEPRCSKAEMLTYGMHVQVNKGMLTL